VTLHFCGFASAERRFLPISYEALSHWFFDQDHGLNYRVMSIADLKLDPTFADHLIEKFQEVEKPTLVTMVISGEVAQNAEQTAGHQVMATGPMPERRVKHKR
jgi:hypothetical protein